MAITGNAIFVGMKLCEELADEMSAILIGRELDAYEVLDWFYWVWLWKIFNNFYSVMWWKNEELIVWLMKSIESTLNSHFDVFIMIPLPVIRLKSFFKWSRYSFSILLAMSISSMYAKTNCKSLQTSLINSLKVFS